ncbi:MAG: phosphatase PAP2 family protein, partial [Bacteroidota bacterium]
MISRRPQAYKVSNYSMTIDKGFQRFTHQNLLIGGLLLSAFLLWSTFALGLRNDHFVLAAVCLSSFYGNQSTRKLFWALLPFIIYWFLYDSMRVYPNYLFNPVHIAEPYHLEKYLFGLNQGGEVITLNEYFIQHPNNVLDVMSALFYLCWVPVPMMYAVYLFWRDRPLLARFSSTFLLVNIIGIIIYYLYPAAPPWYVAKYGFELRPETMGDAAGLLRFDEIMGIQLFENMYTRNANVFAAIPSLHSAFPVVLLFYTVKKGLKYASLLFLVILVGIWFAAIYT